MADTLITKLRRQLGNPTISDIADADLTDCVEIALAEYDKWRPKLVMETLASVADQIEYDLDADTINVRNVLIAGSGTYTSSEAMKELLAKDRADDSTGWPSTYWRQQDLTLQLNEPVAEDGADIFVLEARARSIESGMVALPKDKIALLMKGAEGQARMRYAGYQGTVRFGSASEDRETQREKGQALWDEFLKILKTGYTL